MRIVDLLKKRVFLLMILTSQKALASIGSQCPFLYLVLL